jgi:hypothetical protein
MLNDDRVIIRSEVQHVLVLLSYVSYQTDFLTFLKKRSLSGLLMTIVLALPNLKQSGQTLALKIAMIIYLTQID